MSEIKWIDLTDSEWEEQFEPIPTPSGDTLWEYDEIPDKYKVPGMGVYIWTVVDCDGDEYMCQGWRLVNRVGYMVCKKPWDEGVNYEVLWFDQAEMLAEQDDDEIQELFEDWDEDAANEMWGRIAKFRKTG